MMPPFAIELALKYGKYINQIGGEQMGNENLVLGRAFHGFYSATANNVSYLTDLQFWDSIPAHSKLKNI